MSAVKLWQVYARHTIRLKLNRNFGFPEIFSHGCVSLPKPIIYTRVNFIKLRIRLRVKIKTSWYYFFFFKYFITISGRNNCRKVSVWHSDNSEFSVKSIFKYVASTPKRINTLLIYIYIYLYRSFVQHDVTALTGLFSGEYDFSFFSLFIFVITNQRPRDSVENQLRQRSREARVGRRGC